MNNLKTTIGGVLTGAGLLIAGLKICLAAGLADTDTLAKGLGLVIAGGGAIWHGVHSTDAKKE